MDEIDRKILMLLQANAKQHIKEIAHQVGLTVSPTFERIKKLEQQGYIKEYVAILDKEKVGKAITVFCPIVFLRHSKDLIDNFRAQLEFLPEVMECHHVSGSYDFLLKVAVNSMDEYQAFVVDKLSLIEGISNVQSLFVLEEIKRSTGYEL
ncbi:MAG: Lrp/AsnC family transcriptional regulator [Bacteroidota bacterium]